MRGKTLRVSWWVIASWLYGNTICEMVYAWNGMFSLIAVWTRRPQVLPPLLDALSYCLIHRRCAGVHDLRGPYDRTTQICLNLWAETWERVCHVNPTCWRVDWMLVGFWARTIQSGYTLWTIGWTLRVMPRSLISYPSSLSSHHGYSESWQFMVFSHTFQHGYTSWRQFKRLIIS